MKENCQSPWFDGRKNLGSTDEDETGLFIGSGYGYGTVPGGRWTIDTEGGHVVVSVSLIWNGYEYGTIPIGAELFIRKFRIPNAIASRIRSGYEPCRVYWQSTALTSDDLDTPRAPSIDAQSCIFIVENTLYLLY